MLKQVISFLTGGPVEMVGEYLIKKQEAKQALKLAKLEGKTAVEKAKAEAAAKRQEHIASWEMEQIRNSGWKDEFVLLTISYPVYASFVPKLQDYVAKGFEVLGTTPTWYMGIVITVYLAIYGVRWAGSPKIQLRKKAAE